MRITTIQETRRTLSEAMQHFINYKKANQINERTLRDYRHYLDDFLANSQDILDMQIISQEVLEYFANIPDTSPARYNHPFQYLSSFFNWLIKQEDYKPYINQNPLTSQGLHKKKDDGNIKPASIEDIKTLLKSFDKKEFTGYRNYVITLLMMDTGIRTSELRRLVDTDFDAKAKQIFISKHISKTRKNRIVFLSDSTAKEVEKLISFKPKGWCDLIFPTRDGGQMTCEGMAREFDRQCKKVGVKFTPYQLRHTFASYFVASGGDIFTLQDIMGHADIRMTRRYTEIDTTTKRQQHNAHSPIGELQGNKRLRAV